MVIKLQGFDAIVTFGVSHLFKVLRGHLAPLTVIYALKY